MKAQTYRYWIKEIAIMGAVALAVVLFMQWLQRENQRGGGGVLETGTMAPAFVLADLNGAATSLESLRGKPVILAFWATYCGACRTELPDLDRLTRAAGDKYSVVSVSRERRSVLRDYLTDNDFSFPVLCDSAGRVHDAYKVSTIPMTVIIDKEGRVVHDFVGAADGEILAEHMARLGDS